MTDSFDGSDAKFHATQNQFVGAVVADPSKYGLTAADADAIETTQLDWLIAYPAHLKAKQDARTARQRKEEARRSHRESIRLLARKIQGHPAVDNAMRLSLGLNPRSGTRSPVPAPTTWPVTRVEATARFTLSLLTVDHETMKRAKKPAGAHGFEIWAFVGDSAPLDPSGYSFLALATRSPFLDVRPPADAGKTIHYLTRWQNRRGEPGPWSQVISTKIPY